MLRWFESDLHLEMDINGLRNIAIIAHVDHGKTTLVDEMLKQSGVYRENQEIVDRVMDSNDLERERGITILAKNTAVWYKGVTKINIVDTPGHADFGGEVERILKMVNGVILLVDAAEGPMPQTRFVLSRAGARPPRHRRRQQDRPPRSAHPRGRGRSAGAADGSRRDRRAAGFPDAVLLRPSGYGELFARRPRHRSQAPVRHYSSVYPRPEMDPAAPFQMLVSSIDYNEYVGRIAIGRIERGVISQNQEIEVCNYHTPDAEPSMKAKAVSLYQFDGLNRVPVTEAGAGNIIAMSGIGDVTIGDTICARGCRGSALRKDQRSDLEMTFSVNNSPFAGREGKFVTSRQIRERLIPRDARRTSPSASATSRTAPTASTSPDAAK